MTEKLKVLITCPPMLLMIDHFKDLLEQKNISITTPNFVQTLSISELIKLVPLHHGWIIGDDPATKEVFEAGRTGLLKAAVKWGIGVDNVDFEACKELNIPITNTPNIFGSEVADIALGYVIGCARGTYEIDRAVRCGHWYKPTGQSLSGKNAAIIGFGDIGKQLAKRLIACEMNVSVYDPFVLNEEKIEVTINNWPEKINEADFIILTCSLNDSTFHIINDNSIRDMKDGVSIVNVSRGPLIDETILNKYLDSGKIRYLALDVYEKEPLNKNSLLINRSNIILGSHNASNTKDAVIKASEQAIKTLTDFLKCEYEY
ncbi:MAG: phosphoglycerate dehydrogenase [Candidatus Marinimicrobia bacterium]|nr:phosphoglycerate dehydrogenase [Candidatus Neomarinimicrobiota bacterium]